MHCPECGMEYEAGVTECPDCEVELVDDLGEEDAADGTVFVPLVEATDVLFFSLVTSHLEEAGIPWFVQSEASRGVLPRDGGEAGSAGDQVAVIHVAERRLEGARRLAADAALSAVGESG